MGEIVSSGRNEAILGKDEISFRRRSNARRYIAKVESNGEIVVTIPRGGTQREALGFAQKHREWLRGQQIKTRETLSEKGFIADAAMNLSRPLAENLRGLAKKELPRLANELAARFGLSFKRVSIRDQKTRWGSCSSTGAISLNWRIVLAPPETAEYIVVHELMHLKEMNHSSAFWGLVERACPRYKEHERWLDEHQSELNW